MAGSRLWAGPDFRPDLLEILLLTAESQLSFQNIQTSNLHAVLNKYMSNGTKSYLKMQLYPHNKHNTPAKNAAQ